MNEQIKQYKNVLEFIKLYEKSIQTEAKLEAKICIIDENEDKVFIKKEIRHGKRT